MWLKKELLEPATCILMKILTTSKMIGRYLDFFTATVLPSVVKECTVSTYKMM